MIRLKTCRWKNFLSYGDYITEFNFQDRGISVITGENGIGKSTIIEALSFAWFGKLVRESVKSEIINDRNGKDCMVEVEFEVDDGALITITRTLKPDDIVIKRNVDEILNKRSSTKETQIIINDILSMNFFLFKQFVVQSKTKFLPFLEFDTSERRKFVDKVFNLDVYRAMDKKNKENIKKAELLKGNLEKDIIHFESLVHTNQNFLNDTLEFAKTATEDAEREYAVQLEKMQRDLDVIVENGKSHKSLLDTMTFINELKDKTELNTKFSNLQSIQFNDKRSGDDASKMAYFLENNDVCPTCTQMIKPQWKGMKIAELNTQIATLKANWATVTNELKVIEAEIKEIDAYNSNVSLNNERYNNTAKLVKSCREQFINAKKQLDAFIADGVKVNDRKLSIIELNSRIEKHTGELNNAQKELDKVNDQLLSYINASQLLKDDGIIATIINEYVPELNNYVNKYLGMMGIDMIFELDKNFKDTFYKTYGKSTSYNNLSEGQKLRVNMAVVLAWRDVVQLLGMNITNIIFFDEMFDSSFDPKGTEAFLEILESFENLGIYIITHTPSKVDADAEVFYNVVSENGFSKIVMGN